MVIMVVDATMLLALTAFQRLSKLILLPIMQVTPSNGRKNALSTVAFLDSLRDQGALGGRLRAPEQVPSGLRFDR